jgi:hypothetical protein
MYFIYQEDLTIRAIRTREPHGDTYVRLSDLKHMLEAELASSTFALGQCVLSQSEGICMGPPASPGLALMTVLWIRASRMGPPSALITQYMDDVLICQQGNTRMLDLLTRTLHTYKMELVPDPVQTNSFQFLQYHIQTYPHLSIQYKPRDKLRWIQYEPGINTGRYIRWCVGQLCAIIDASLTRQDIYRSLTTSMRTWAQRGWPNKVIRAAIRWAVKKRLSGAEEQWIRLFQQSWHKAKIWHRNHTPK